MSAARWWISAQGRAWGPYPIARLRAFRDEGRFGPDSLVGREEAGPFVRAADTPELATLSGGATSAEPSARDGAEAPTDRALLVISDVPEAERPRFEAALGDHGEAVWVRPGLWLLRSSDAASALRNALSRRLQGAAMLLVVEASAKQAAWFNLDGDTDRALRRLWNGS